MAGHFTLEGANGDIALEILKEVTDVLDKNGIEYWLEGGTLLGVVRENRLLPWDNDMDISIKEDYYDKFIEILPQLNKLNRSVRVRKFTKDNEPFQKGVSRIVKVRNKKMYFFKGEVTLDIFIKFKKDDEYFWQVGKKKKSVPSYFYDELIEYAFDGKQYLIPKAYEAYLTFRYGDWKIPVKEWDTFNDDKAVKGNI